MNIEEFAKKFIEAEDEAWKSGNFDALEQIESPGIVIHMPPVPDIVGFEAHKQSIVTSRESFNDLQQDWDYITGDGDVCVLSYKSSSIAKVENPALNIPAGAKSIIDFYFVLRRENNRVAEIWMRGSRMVQ